MVKIHLLLPALFVFALASVQAQDTAVPAAPVTLEEPAPIEPPVAQAPTPQPIAPPVQQNAQPVRSAHPAAPATNAAAPQEMPPTDAHPVNEFQGDEVAQVLRLLGRQGKLNVVISDKIDSAQPPLKVTMRLEDKTPLEAIKVIAQSKGLIIDELNGVYYVKTQQEKAAEPTKSANYTFAYASADKVVGLLASQLQSHAAPQFDQRTNTVFYREVESNLKNIELFLQTIDKPTQQVMIEARLVEVNANPKQSYGLNWAGVVGSSLSPQTFKYGGTQLGTFKNVPAQTVITNGNGTVTTTPLVDSNGIPIQVVQPDSFPTVPIASNGQIGAADFLGRPEAGNLLKGSIAMLAGQFAIVSAPQMSVTMRLLNEDSDAEFLANPRIVTASNQTANIKITRNQPVPQLNFNEQTATAVFGGFVDKEFGNTLQVTPIINKDDFVTLNVKPEISNKVGDSVFNFAGATVTSPIIDKRTLESNVLIKSGDTLAIGGLLQDETNKARTKVPILGDLPILGYAFTERINARSKRNLLVFVTPTIIKQGYGTGLENQVSGLHNSGEEYADPNGWRNNAKGAVRYVPTSNRPNAADYPKPGAPIQPAKYKVSAVGREK